MRGFGRADRVAAMQERQEFSPLCFALGCLLGLPRVTACLGRVRQGEGRCRFAYVLISVQIVPGDGLGGP